MTKELYNSLLSDNYVYIDFEFNNTHEFELNILSVAFLNGQRKLTLWLKDPLQLKTFHEIMDIMSDKIFVCYQAVAEARSLLDLGYWAPDLKFIDLYLEYRQLSNSNDEISYGKHLVDGKVKMTVKPKPKWERTEEDAKTGFKQTFSLAEAVYKFTGKIIDTKRKDEIRDLIISNPETFSKSEIKEIKEYNLSDIEYMPQLFYKMLLTYQDLLLQEDYDNLFSYMLNRGDYSARTAVMEKLGYPVNMEKMRNLTNAVPNILRTLQQDINSQFPNTFKFHKKDASYSWNQTLTKEWIKNNHDEATLREWQKTDGGDYSLSLEAFKRFYDYRHDYPRNNFGAQMVRYLTTKQNLNGFATKENSGKKTIWDYVGSDGRVRPYFNIYGSQTSRSQPSSTSFLFLKSAWMRVLCEPPPGKAICGIDYGSEEYLISAIWSMDQNMIEAYKTGDVYLSYAKQIGEVPQDGTKAEYKEERNKKKPIILGMSYLISKFGLSHALTASLKREVSEDEAQEEIDRFYETYPDLKEFQDFIRDIYYNGGEYLKGNDGWILFQDNDNFRSVVNFFPQQTGGGIMRRDVKYAQEAGLDVIFTLHDAIYIEFDKDDLSQVDILLDCMYRAFVDYFPEEEQKEAAKLIRMDAHAWSPEYVNEGKFKTPKGATVEISKLYIDERAENEYEKYKDYLEIAPIEL